MFGNESAWIWARYLAIKDTSILTLAKWCRLNKSRQLDTTEDIFWHFDATDASHQTVVALNEVVLWFRPFAFVWCSGQKRPQIEERLHCEDNFYRRWTVLHFVVDYSPWEFSELCIVIPRASLIDRFTSAQWARLMACPHTTNWCKANTKLKIRLTPNVQVRAWRILHEPYALNCISVWITASQRRIIVILAGYRFVINFRNKF